MRLADQECSSYELNNHPLPRAKAEELLRETPRWALKDKTIEREFQFKDFRKAMEFVNKVAEIAQQQDHHPDILIRYNRVTLTLSTHRVGGLSPKDFVLAAKIDLAIQQVDNLSKGVR